MGEPQVKKAGSKLYRELRDRGVPKADAARAANKVKAPAKKKPAAKKRAAAKKKK